MFLTEKAFPEEDVVINLERGLHSSSERCNVFDIRDEIAECDSGSTLIHVKRDLLENIFRTLSQT